MKLSLNKQIERTEKEYHTAKEKYKELGPKALGKEKNSAIHQQYESAANENQRLGRKLRNLKNKKRKIL